MAWIYVLFAGIVEVLWVLGLKYAYNPLTWAVTAALIILSFFFIMKANEKLPAGTVYAVFTGMGTSGIVLVDIFFFGNPVSLTKILFLCCIVTGVIGIKLVTGKPESTSENDDGENKDDELAVNANKVILKRSEQ